MKKIPFKEWYKKEATFSNRLISYIAFIIVLIPCILFFLGWFSPLTKEKILGYFSFVSIFLCVMEIMHTLYSGFIKKELFLFPDPQKTTGYIASGDEAKRVAIRNAVIVAALTILLQIPLIIAYIYWK